MNILMILRCATLNLGFDVILMIKTEAEHHKEKYPISAMCRF